MCVQYVRAVRACSACVYIVCVFEGFDVCLLVCVQCVRYVRAVCACSMCVQYVRAVCACSMCVRYVRAVCACVQCGVVLAKTKEREKEGGRASQGTATNLNHKHAEKITKNHKNDHKSQTHT